VLGVCASVAGAALVPAGTTASTAHAEAPPRRDPAPTINKARRNPRMANIPWRAILKVCTFSREFQSQLPIRRNGAQ
jgi:hypothetical protein